MKIKSTDHTKEPFIPIHPGEVLKDEIEYRHISEDMLAGMTGIDKDALQTMLSCKSPLTPEIAFLIEEALDIPTAPLLKMQLEYDIQTVRRNPTFLHRLAKVRKYVAVL